MEICFLKNTAWTAMLYKIYKHEPQASGCYNTDAFIILI
jgi:hypothetical protein